MAQSSNVAEAFLDYMHTHGVMINDTPLPDRILRRFCDPEGKKGNLDYWYIYDGHGGMFGNHKDIQKTWIATRPDNETKEDRQKRIDSLRAMRDQAAQERKEKHEEGIIRANKEWLNQSLSGDSAYLERKGILFSTPTIRYGTDRHRGNYICIPLVDTYGQITSLQYIYDDKGSWANDKKFMSGGTIKGCFHVIGWKDNALQDDSKPIIICEGFATGATLHHITAYPVFCAMTGSANLRAVSQHVRQTYPKRHIMIAADNDAHGKGHLWALSAIKELDNSTVILPVFKNQTDKDGNTLTDFNDLFVVEGIDAVRTQFGLSTTKITLPKKETVIEKTEKLVITSSTPFPKEPARLIHKKDVIVGDDQELARLMIDGLEEELGTIVYNGDAFFYFENTHWKSISDNDMQVKILNKFNYTYFVKGLSTFHKAENIKVGEGRLKSVFKIMTCLLQDVHFFQAAPIGVNCQFGFITLDRKGQLSLQDHCATHSQTNVLTYGQGIPKSWDGVMREMASKNDGYVHKLFEGCFGKDVDKQDKIDLIFEARASAMFGLGTKIEDKRAIACNGPLAANGKSEILKFIRSATHPENVCSLNPILLSDKLCCVDLIGKTLNITDELPEKSVENMEMLKLVISGETIMARAHYKSPVYFEPTALHVFAMNRFLTFKNGMDRGIQRRFLAIAFNRRIPKEERIKDIAQKAIGDEPDYIFYQTLKAAQRLMKNQRFTMPISSKILMDEWRGHNDPVFAWVNECVSRHPTEKNYEISTSRAFDLFLSWFDKTGWDKNPPTMRQFVVRMKEIAPEYPYKRSNGQTRFEGLWVEQ